MSPAAIGTAFCAAIISGNPAEITPLLTPELAQLAPFDTSWHTGEVAPKTCVPVGASGTLEHPESVLFLTFPGGTTASDKLVLTSVGKELRVDDVVFANGTTVREALASPWL